MTPYYQDGSVTIYHADSTTFQVSGLADVVVTDPPYDLAGDEMAAYLVGLMPNAAVFGWPEALVRIAMAAGRVPDDWLVWWPTNAALRRWGPKGQTPRESEHIAVWGTVRWVHGAPSTATGDKLSLTNRPMTAGARGKVRRSPLGKKWGDVWTDPSPGLGFQSDNRLHVNEKPLPIMVRLLNVVADGTVLDPFMGSGTTLVAAKLLGRKAIGIEIDEAHCETAATRLSQETLGLTA